MFDVKVVKVPRVLKEGFHLQPELEDGLDTIGKRLERRGRGLGDRNNSLNRERFQMGQRITYSTNRWPRSSGRKKLDKLTSIFKGMAPRVINKVAKRIQERWAE